MPFATSANPDLNSTDLQTIPGIGPSMAVDLHDLGIRVVADLAERDPQDLYDELSAIRGVQQDRCVLYVFRCATYYATHSEHDPALLKWWNWKDLRKQGDGGRSEP